MQNIHDYKPGIYLVTQGEYKDAAIFLIEISDPEESDFTYMTIFNPETEDSHEVSSEEWLVMAEEDGLKWQSDIPNEIKDIYLKGGNFAAIDGLE